MAILKLKTYPEPILKQRAEEIEHITPEIKKLAQNMIQTMVANQGVGLAGPQVGVSKRIIVIQTNKSPAVFINPVIKKSSGGEEVLQEGCLSLPGFWRPVKRAQRIEVEALGPRGKKIKIKTKGFAARIFQHEIDHLNGVLINDLALSPIQ